MLKSFAFLVGLGGGLATPVCSAMPRSASALLVALETRAVGRGQLAVVGHPSEIASRGTLWWDPPLAVRDDAAKLHPAHIMGHLLSRCAAGVALDLVVNRTALERRLKQGSVLDVSTVRKRQDALHRHHVHLSLSHETNVACAYAVPEAASTGACCGSCGVDVVDVRRIEALTRRFPIFVKRWIPCIKDSATTSVEIAVGWSYRECLVKCLGISGRAFEMCDVAFRAANMAPWQHGTGSGETGSMDLLRVDTLSVCNATAEVMRKCEFASEIDCCAFSLGRSPRYVVAAALARRRC